MLSTLFPLYHALVPVAIAPALCAVPGSQAPLLFNDSFDQVPLGDDGSPSGWHIAVYGAQPSVTLDDPAPALAGTSLRISSDKPSDTAVYQDLSVTPSGWYRLSGWVRTEGLSADTSIHGAFCACDGPMPYSCTPNRDGDTPWRHESIVVRAPTSGVMRVAVFLVGFGQGTGTAWFDGLEVEPVSAGEAAGATVKVTDEPESPAPISPWIYGNFVEFLDHHVQGMRAQMLDDVSFEGILPPSEWCYWQTDKDVYDRPWIPTGLGGDGAVDRVNEGAFNGGWCYRLSVPTSPGLGIGIRQRGLCLRKGGKYTLSFYLRQEDLDGPIRATLGHDYGPFVSAYAVTDFTGVTGEWRKHTAVLEPDTDDDDAELSIRVASRGTVWVDQVTLVPDDNIKGWRRDVVDSVRALKPNCLRFGGSAVIAYDWTKGIGDPDKRVPFPNWPWGRMEPNDVGIDEFLQFCELVDAEPLVCASYNVGSAADAAAEVEYCNGPADSEWGSRRAANGHPEPYGVKLWQVGNEQAGEEYEQRLPDYCRAMLAADPTIELLTAFPSDGVIEGTKDLVRYVCPHYYSTSIPWMVADIRAQREHLRRLAPGRNIRIGVTEWNGTAGDWGPARAMMATQSNALYCARVLHTFQRNSDLVAMANRSGLMNGWCCGNIQTSPRGLWVTPAYYTMQLLSRHCGTRPLKVVSDDGAELRGPEFGALLDAMATLSDDGRKLTVTVVNEGGNPVETALDLSAHLRGHATATRYTLAAEGPFAVNDEARPDHVKPTESSMEVELETWVEFPAWSLTVIEVGV